MLDDRQTSLQSHQLELDGIGADPALKLDNLQPLKRVAGLGATHSPPLLYDHGARVSQRPVGSVLALDDEGGAALAQEEEPRALAARPPLNGHRSGSQAAHVPAELEHCPLLLDN